MTGTSGVLFPDDFKLNIGTGSDLQIYHDGTHNYIDGITNDLYIRTVTPGDDVVVQAYDDLFLYVANGVDALIARGGGTVELYHNGAKKLETTSTGVTIGPAPASTNLELNLNGLASKAIRIQFQESGTNRWLLGQGAASENSNFELYNSAGTITMSANRSTNVVTFASDVNLSKSVNTASSVAINNLNTGSSAQSRFLAVSDGGNIQLKSVSIANTTYGAGDAGVINCDTMSGGFRIAHNDVTKYILAYNGENTWTGGGTFGGTVSLTSTSPILYLNNTTASTGKNWRLSSEADGNAYITHAGVVDAITLSHTSGNATFAGTVTSPTFLGDLNGTINTVTTAVTKANATNDTTVATTAFVQNLIGTIPAGLVFQGTWNAATNTPTLTSGTGTTGNFYIVSVAGTTSLDGITDWQVGDWAVFVEQGATDAWEKVDNSSVLDGSGTGQTVALWSGSGTSNTLTDAPITVSGNNTTFAGTINSGYITSTAGATFAGTVTTDGLFVNASATGNAKIVAADQAYARLAIDNLNGQEWNLIAGTAGASNSGFGIYDADAAATRLQITSAGNVGIGTTSPGYKLDVNVGIGTASPATKLVVISGNAEKCLTAR
jgi:hypothetical protein